VIPTTRAAITHARRIEALAKRRSMRETALRIAAEAEDIDGDVNAYVGTAEAQVLAVADRKAQRRSVSLMHALGEMLTRISTPALREQRMPSGMWFVDDILRGGARRGRLVVVAARPGWGKTAFAMKWSLSTAATGEPVLFHTLEMQADELAERVAASVGGVDLASIGAGELSGEEQIAVVNACNDAAHLPITIDDTAGVSLGAVASRARRVKRANDDRLGMVVVDYLQLMGRVGGKNDREDQMLGAITRGLKVLAKEMSVVVLLLCQLNRKIEERGDRRPVLSDLRGSGEIEQDADAILFLHPVSENGEEVDGVAEVIVAKQRGGRTGAGRVAWHKRYVRFADAVQRWDGDDYAM